MNQGRSNNMDANYYIKLAIIIFLFINFLCPLLKVFRKVIRKKLRYKRYLDSPLASIDRMKGDEFEEYLAAHFRKLGYHVSLTPKSNDYGADLIIKKDGKIVIPSDIFGEIELRLVRGNITYYALVVL